MAAAAADKTDLKTQEGWARTKTYVVKNSTTVYKATLVGLSGGYLQPWDDTAITQRFLGVMRAFTPAIYSGSVVTAGNTSATPKIRGEVDVSGAILRSVDVAGVTAVTDIGKPVYCATDNIDDLSLTGTVFSSPVGVLDDFRSTSDMDVRLYTPEEYAAIASRMGYWCFPVQMSTIANGDLITTFTPGFYGRIIDWWWVCTVAVTTGGKTATLNIEIGTTNATGGTLVPAGAYALGAVQAQAAAFSAGVAFGPASTVSIEASSVTTFIEGAGVICVRYAVDG